VVFRHGFCERSGLYHRLGNALNGAGIELRALDQIGHELTEGDRAPRACTTRSLRSGCRSAPTCCGARQDASAGVALTAGDAG
jgi:hypothetical protein